MTAKEIVEAIRLAAGAEGIRQIFWWDAAVQWQGFIRHGIY